MGTDDRLNDNAGGLSNPSKRVVVPGRPDEDYIEYTPGWLQSAQSNKRKIMSGIVPYLNDSSSETVMKFTFGEGTTNHEREAYFVGWEFVKTCLDEGVNFEELAGIKEKDIPNYVMEKMGKVMDDGV